MFNPTYCKHNIRIARSLSLAYGTCAVASFILATVIAWMMFHKFTWQALAYYLVCLTIAKLSTSQLGKELRSLRLWKKYLSDATTDPSPRVKRPACTASILGSNNAAH